MTTRVTHFALGAALAVCAAMSSAQAVRPTDQAQRKHWTTSWIAPAEPTWDKDFALPLGMAEELKDSTLRQHLRVSLGGERIRLVISNEYSGQPLKVGAVHVAVEGHPVGADVLFQGAHGVFVAAGAKALSDPIDLQVRDGSRLKVDIYLPGAARIGGFHWDARDLSTLLTGNVAGKVGPAQGQALGTRAFLSAVQVESSREPATVVTLGDSITDGNGSTPGADHRWPDFLARRMQSHGVAVLNAGISGNRLLRPGMGESAMARLERDALQQTGVRGVVALLGTNDIGWPGAAFAPGEALPDLDELTQGFRQFVAQAHVRGVRVIGATLPPFEDALKGTPFEGHYSRQKDALRNALNQWIRTSGTFDGVADFDRLLRDESRPSRMREAYDSGDHLHPNDAGYKAMAELIDLQGLLGGS
ncbi:SGNH/GDSL hydrolase family protein [Variovorax sp. OV329]|uniref:SGNH/GDSL hydrolase family protein n=1 Tax=Variovorax sp. OV329 TaxID=1882825 RepID=UPI0008DEFF93|nr:SGNH/GDSL hydrolase family protein [Variovorax sp. OV329]SFN23961.1 Lysophospholipase L1 [Variovorax sp. OV329]